jgi:hypothetical protein
MTNMLQSVWKGWNRFWFSPSRPGGLGVARIYFYAAMLWLTWDLDISNWYHVSRVYWFPMESFRWLGLTPVSPERAAMLQLAFKACLAMACMGFLTRFNCVLSALMAFYLCGLENNFVRVGHGFTLPVILCGIFAFGDAGADWSVDTLLRKKFGWKPRPAESGDYTWPLQLICMTFALVFFGAGYSKLYRSGLEWIFSDNFSNMLVMHHYFSPPPLDWGLWIAQHQWLCVIMAFSAVMLEICAPLGLWNNYLKAIIFGGLLLMQIGIWLLIGVKFTPYFFCYPLLLPWHRISECLESLDFAWFTEKRVAQ